MRWMAVLILVLFAAVFASNEAVAEKYKRVSATKYEKGKPFKGYEFTFAREADGYTTFFTKFEDESLASLKLIEYRNAERRYVYGLLDTSGRKPKWVAEPKYKYISLMGDGMALLRRPDNSHCLLLLEAETCTDVDFEKAMYVGVKDLPWAAKSVLAKYKDARRLDLTFLSPSGQVIGEVQNVAHAIDTGAFSKFGDIESREYGAALMLRMYGEDGEAYDAAILPSADGLSVTRLPPISMFIAFSRVDRNRQQNAQHYREYMFTADADEGLYWPFYSDGVAFKTAPGNLQGIKPLYNKEAPDVCFRDGYQGGKKDQCPAVVPKDTNVLCCDKPVGWLAKWLTDDGIRWAVVRKDTFIPTFEEVLASRDNAKYEVVQRLGSYDGKLIGLDDVENRKTNLWVFVRDDGNTDVLHTKWDHALNWSVMEDYASFPTNAFETWLNQERARVELATIRAEQLQARIRAQQAAAAEASQIANAAYQEKLRETRLREQAERAAREEALRAQWAEIEAIERERAQLKMEMELSSQGSNPWMRMWNAAMAAPISGPSQPAYRPTPEIDYWKSYDSSNLTGSYVTSSGAAVGCTLGSGGVDC